MTDELEFLMDFRAEVGLPSEETRRRIYAQVTQATPHAAWRGRHLRPRLALSLACAVTVVTASVVAAVIFAGPGSRPGATEASLAPELPGPTLARPLLPPAHQVALADATSAFGAPIVLPNTTLVEPSNAGPVWEGSSGTSTTVAVTYPSQGVMIIYIRPAPFSDPVAAYQGFTQSLPESQVVQLNGTPAWLLPQNSDDTGANFGAVLFEVNGTEVRVMGHNDAATLEGIAQSILSQSVS
jgi:hypothetical protein